MRSVVQQQEKVESKNNAIWSETIWNWLCIGACETKHQKSSASGILSLTRIDKQISVVCYSYFNISNDIILYIIKCEFFEFNSLRSWYIALRDSPSIAYNTAIVLVSGVTPPHSLLFSVLHTHTRADRRTDRRTNYTLLTSARSLLAADWLWNARSVAFLACHSATIDHRQITITPSIARECDCLFPFPPSPARLVTLPWP